MVLQIILALLCASCSQDDIVNLITTGAEASAVGGMIALSANPVTGPFVGIIKTGLSEASTGAIEVLNDANATLTLQQVLDLAFSQDPNLTKILPVINFCLPVLMNISAVKNALNSAVQNISPTVKADVIAFFTGIQNGLGGPLTQERLVQILKNNPKIDCARLKAAVRGDFDPNALVNAITNAINASAVKSK